MYTTIISREEAFAQRQSPSWVFIDCRFHLSDKARGHAQYLEEHIAGAVYADLEKQLSGPVVPGVTGRHPLPEKAALVRDFGEMGIGAASQVIAYDEKTGGMAASRLWWLLKWAGHSAVAVLDGGLHAWKQAGFPLESGAHQNAPSAFVPRFDDTLVCASKETRQAAAEGACLLIDSRAQDRYRGENETIDPVAGHIPGAVCLPFTENFDENGRLLSAETLRARFQTVTGARSPRETIFYCGSGVTATQNILAFASAGNGMPRLYAGSWSEWIADRQNPIATGADR